MIDEAHGWEMEEANHRKQTQEHVEELAQEHTLEHTPELSSDDPFVPFNHLPVERHHVVTMRAVLLGLICGALINASNIYIGLKTGATFEASLFGAIIGFSILKPLGRSRLGAMFPTLGGEFGPRENNIVQTAATAAGSMSSVFVSGIPALYRLGLLSANPKADYPRLITITLVGGYFGLLTATPLREFFIIHAARDLKLIFPTASAIATTIRTMHKATAGTGERIAILQMKALGIAFSCALLLRVVSQYAIGILWDWHIFTWIFIWSGYHNQTAIHIENWGWMVEWTPVFIGAGMLVGLNTAISFFGGSVLAWGIIGPLLVRCNAAVGISLGEPGSKWENYISFRSLGKNASSKDAPSPRFWLLWPGVLLMIVVSFVELGLQYKIFIYILKEVCRRLSTNLKAFCKAIGCSSKLDFQHKNALPNNKSSPLGNRTADQEPVKWWMWLPALVLIIILACVVMGLQFGMQIGMSLLSVFLAFLFSILAIQCTGTTGLTPLTAASKASQIVLGGVTKGEHWQPQHAQRLNLLAGSLASIGANQASDLVVDFRVGFLLRTPPVQQLATQAIGTIVAVFLAPALFILFAHAYPCILDSNAQACPFSTPSVSAWQAIAIAMTDPEFPVPTSSEIFAIALSFFGAIMVCVRHFVYRGKWERYSAYHPNMMCIGLAFVLPQTVYSLAMVMGAVSSYVWARRSLRSFGIANSAVAAGFIAGEGIGGVINAIFQIAGIAGPTPYGTNVACPMESC
ncbi:hypothetical protein CKM354_000623600 [Cercospora kikuchii]|uniref:Oligopeptide transporter n=1 Tax=Cercospora kikuchii TaxID=84275 RepID=A0A9P3FI09_9PEZI|nr:uncharacterized protein CKM354_000623600 [Cercospora kikuchii]GIZ42990.1 hypothetical protein CKM354_000623600 [Cercospora kikuchii]